MNRRHGRNLLLLVLISMAPPLTSSADITFLQTTYGGINPGDRNVIEFKVAATHHDEGCDIDVFVMPTRIVVIAGYRNTWFPRDTSGTFDHELVIYGSAFNDRINIFGERPMGLQLKASVAGLGGDDYVRVHKNIPSWLVGNHGNDALHGGSERDYILGGLGDDVIGGGGGHDQLHGQEGDDIVWGHSGRDLIAGGPGEDYLVGGADDDELWGNERISSLSLLAYWFYQPDMQLDVMHGGAGRDRFHSNFYFWHTFTVPYYSTPVTNKYYVERELVVDLSRDDTLMEHQLPGFKLPVW